MINRLFWLVLLLIAVSCSNVAPPEPVLPVPSERQLAWNDMEYYAFIHFNMNTFSNMEWGFGDESPELFNPSELDCRQWARICKEAGMKGIILTAKHHDGFCLWPTATTEHSVINSPWKNGEGDVVRELADACEEYDLKLGLYLSPWDRNNPEYGNDEYIDIFRAQLRELMSNYGDVFEVWFDGANGGTGYYGGANEERRVDKLTYYDWDNTYKIIRELQPGAVIFSDAGPDVRWVGNEHGYAYPTTWSNLMRDEIYGGMPEYSKKYSKGQENGTHWVPAEADVSIRPGWYYHPYEDHKVKTLPQLLDIYYNSIGRNGSLLINFPVDTRGLIHEKDEEQILKLAEAVKADLAHDLAAVRTAEASNVRGNSKKFNALNVIDDDPDTYWATDDGVVQASLTIDLGEETTFNRFLVKEDIRLGQRVKKFSVEAYINNKWKQIDSQTTIGRKRILRLPETTASKVRFSVEDSKACPVITKIGIYHAPKVIVEPKISRSKDGVVSIEAFDSGLDIYYTIDGSSPDVKYNEPFELSQKATVKAIVVDPNENKTSTVSVVDFDVPKTKWKLVGKYENAERANLIFDGNEKTAFTVDEKAPVDFVVDLGESLTIKGFKYLPDQQRFDPGIIFNYKLYLSSDGKNWKQPVSEGEFSNIRNSPVWQTKSFDPVAARYIKFTAVSPAEENGKLGIAEFDVTTQ
ncbi:alpha-L-fucosidase [Draconibacterium halophilum]|uniref:alpha-L-fucosidase n=1 Tax=Draconibacterium halophilum TaxID=2706887 RepID=A0A6C0RGE2_9BACT|nr:alpha-L-fucosidase [Draconibacterium halophilum]QIA08902.1 alpha-L-fucosidase [Draconibacterium halophilum]